MWQFKLLSSLVISNASFASKRFCHFKFNSSKLKKQQAILGRFESDINNVMTKVILRSQQIKTKRSKGLLTQSTKLLMNEDVPKDDGFNYSKGSPDQLVLRREGMNRTFLTTRMKVMNSNYSRAVAEIFISDDELSKKVQEYQFRITQVRVTTNLKHLQIYWVIQAEEFEPLAVAEFLNINKGRIRGLLTEALNVTYLPWIIFVYDVKEANNFEISSRLTKCAKDLVVESTEKEALENGKAAQSGAECSFKLSDQISFEDPFYKVPVEELYQRIINCNFQDYYGPHKLQMPSEMQLNAYNLDYEHLINKVLQNLHRCRANQQLYAVAPNAVGAHLPPINFNANDNPASPVNYNTDERIKSIKKFVALSKKRKEQTELKLRRTILQEEVDRFDSYEDLRDRLEERMATQLKRDVQGTVEEETCSDFSPIN